MSRIGTLIVIALSSLLWIGAASAAMPLGTEFTYQGQLTDNGSPANGVYDLRFLLYSDATGGTQIGSTEQIDDMTIADGMFSVELDFGSAAFDGSAVWLDIRVRDGSDTGNFTTLSPRQAITAAPYALHTRGVSVDADANVSFSRGESESGITRLLTIGGARNGGNTAFGRIDFQNYDDNDPTPEDYIGASIQCYNGAGDEAGEFRFFTRPAGDDQGNLSPLNLAMQIRGDGNIDIGGEYFNPANFDRVLSIEGPGDTGISLTRLDNDHTWSIGSASGDILTWSRDNGNNNRDVMTLTRSGNLSLGAGDSTNVFALQGNGSTRPVGITQNEYGGGSSMELTTADASDQQATRLLFQGGRDDPNIEFLTGSRGAETQTMIIDGATGNVGVGGGVNNPSNFDRVLSLQAENSAAATFTRTSSGTTWSTGVNSGDGFNFFRNDSTGSKNVMTMLPAGNVGIGKNTPLAQLDVFGGTTAIYGEADTGLPGNQNRVGVVGVANGGNDTNFGVFGAATGGSTNYAGYFSGNVHVNGTLSKAGGSFKIDDPLDPANKYLSHSFVESPDMMNIYNGNIVTDADGFAVVELPDWFEPLNRDFRYQLTVIGSFARAMVAEEVKDNAFVIRTNEPNVKVSWQVTGIRHDPWADAHRIPVEEEKPERERGLYLHPELYGKDKSFGMTNSLDQRSSVESSHNANAR